MLKKPSTPITSPDGSPLTIGTATRTFPGRTAVITSLEFAQEVLTGRMKLLSDHEEGHFPTYPDDIENLIAAIAHATGADPAHVRATHQVRAAKP